MSSSDQIVLCPRCDNYIEILDINCGIFRHAVYKIGLNQMNPHASEIECEKAIEEQTIYGCGKPFRINKIENELKIEKCDYI